VKPAPPSALLAKCVDRLVVLNDLDNDAKGPYDWSPLPADRGKSSGSLAQWMLSPWGGPDQVVLPGFHTPAESALKRGGTGDEMFLAVCGFMSTGSRTILLSRWRDGGRTSYDLVREFVRELPHRRPATPGSGACAWPSIGGWISVSNRASNCSYRRDPQGRTSVLLERLHAGRYGVEPK